MAVFFLWVFSASSLWAQVPLTEPEPWTVPLLEGVPESPEQRPPPPPHLREVLRQPAAIRDESLKPRRLSEQERQLMREQLRKPVPSSETQKP